MNRCSSRIVTSFSRVFRLVTFERAIDQFSSRSRIEVFVYLHVSDMDIDIDTPRTLVIHIGTSQLVSSASLSHSKVWGA